MRLPSVGGRALGRSRVVVLVIAGAIGGCDGRREAEGKANANANANAKAHADLEAGANTNPNVTVEAGPHAAAGGALPICRVMASEGGPSATADATRWLDVAAGATFTVRTLETGRELRFEGPGRVRACGDDVALVAEGAAVGLPGSGEAPGAEQWAATACGVARWASGIHRLVAARDGCKLQSSMGTAQLWLAEDITADEVPVDAGAPDAKAPPPAPGDAGRGPGTSPWQRIEAKRALRLHGRGPLDTAPSVKLALGSCERAAQRVQALAARMNTGSGDGGPTNLGELAAESVVARGIARAACSVAAIRIVLGGSREGDQARLDAANSSWRAPR